MYAGLRWRHGRSMIHAPAACITWYVRLAGIEEECGEDRRESNIETRPNKNLVMDIIKPIQSIVGNKSW